MSSEILKWSQKSKFDKNFSKLKERCVGLPKGKISIYFFTVMFVFHCSPGFRLNLLNVHVNLYFLTKSNHAITDYYSIIIYIFANHVIFSETSDLKNCKGVVK